MPDRNAINAPVKSYNFSVELSLGGDSVSGWKRVDLPGQETGTTTYREGNHTSNGSSLQGGTTVGADLIMERGAKQGETMLWNWHKKVRQGKLDEARKALAVIIYDSSGSPLLRYEFQGAWPKRYEPPTLDAEAGNLGTETLVVTYDQMERTQ